VKRVSPSDQGVTIIVAVPSAASQSWGGISVWRKAAGAWPEMNGSSWTGMWPGLPARRSGWRITRNRHIKACLLRRRN